MSLQDRAATNCPLVALHVQTHQTKSNTCATAESTSVPCSQYQATGSLIARWGSAADLRPYLDLDRPASQQAGAGAFGSTATPPCNPCLEPCADYPDPPDPSYLDARIDFQTPGLLGRDKLLVDPYVDPATGIAFHNGADRAIGLVINSPDISSCGDSASQPGRARFSQSHARAMPACAEAG